MDFGYVLGDFLQTRPVALAVANGRYDWIHFVAATDHGIKYGASLILQLHCLDTFLYPGNISFKKVSAPN
jgi:hypothetical protein